MIEMTIRVPFSADVPLSSTEVARADLLALAEAVKAHEDARIELEYDTDVSLSPVALTASWEAGVSRDGAQ